MAFFLIFSGVDEWDWSKLGHFAQRGEFSPANSTGNGCFGRWNRI